jgi:NAD-dependent SIR2 family protein deacetylase
VRVVVLIGAGISTESGVPTFRDADGLWDNQRIRHGPASQLVPAGVDEPLR